MVTSLRDYLTDLDCLRVHWVKIVVLLGRDIPGGMRGATFCLLLLYLRGRHAVPARNLTI